MIAAVLAGVSRLVSGVQVEWQCDPRVRAPRIYYANHTSHLDAVLIWSAVPAERRHMVRPVAGKDYWCKGPVRRYLALQVFHAVLIDRAGGGASCGTAGAHASVERMIAAIDNGQSLIVFPEGTRGTGAAIGPLKSGLYHLARLRPDAELVPVYLDNLNRILPKGERLPVPMLSRVVFGPPLAIATGEDKSSFLERARGALLQLRGSCAAAA